MAEVIFEVKPVPTVWCSYPGCDRLNGKVRQAKWLIRRLGSEGEFRPVCFICKSHVKREIGALEQRVTEG